MTTMQNRESMRCAAVRARHVICSLARAFSAACLSCMLSNMLVAASLRCALAARSGGHASCIHLALSSVAIQGSFFEVVERAANGCALGAGAATRKVKY